MLPADPLARRTAFLVFAHALISVLMSAGLLVAAVLGHAPAGALPVLVLAVVGGPMLATLGIPAAVRGLREYQPELARMRRQLRELPEVPHPLGL